MKSGGRWTDQTSSGDFLMVMVDVPFFRYSVTSGVLRADSGIRLATSVTRGALEGKGIHSQPHVMRNVPERPDRYDGFSGCACTCKGELQES
jgi:hypothetical protein